MKIFNATKRTLLADDVKVARTFLERSIGLLNRENLKNKEALVLPSCQCIHMFFMKFSIDVIFMGKDDKIIGMADHVNPFEVSPFFIKAVTAIELPAGTIETTRSEIGDVVEFQD